MGPLGVSAGAEETEWFRNPDERCSARVWLWLRVPGSERHVKGMVLGQPEYLPVNQDPST